MGSSENHAGLVDQGSGNGCQLLFPAGNGIGTVITAVTESHSTSTIANHLDWVDPGNLAGRQAKVNTKGLGC